MSNKQSTPTKAYGVQWYNQYPKQMLRPYGELKEPLSEEEILDILKPINCEYFLRPKIALSEMSETASKNYERAIDLLKKYDLDFMSAKLEHYSDTVKMLNSRTDQSITREDVLRTMRYHATEDEDVLTLMDDLEIIGNCFFTTAMHFKTLRVLICNPKVYGQTSAMANGADSELKSNPTVKTVKELLMKEACTVRRVSHETPKKRHQILDELNDSDSTSDHSKDDEPAIPPSGTISKAKCSPLPAKSASAATNKEGKSPLKRKAQGVDGRDKVRRELWAEDDPSTSKEKDDDPSLQKGKDDSEVCTPTKKAKKAKQDKKAKKLTKPKRKHLNY